MASPLRLDGQVAYVTGSTRGIGRAIARTFAEHGANVVVNGRTSQMAVAQTADELSALGTTCTGLFLDQSDAGAATRAFLEIFRTYGRLDILVNNAGVLDTGLLGMIPEQSVDNSFGINALAIVRNMQAAAKLMRRHGRGSVINISSIIGVNGTAGEVVYGGTKAAVIGMTRSAAKEMAPLGVRVNAIAPGFIDTDLTRSLTPELFEERASRIGMGRVGQPQDVANVALFLASTLSAYVTGQVIGVDGAMVI